MGRQKVFLEKMARIFQIRNKLMRQALAECLGTLILVVRHLCCFCHRFIVHFFRLLVLARKLICKNKAFKMKD